MDSNNTQAFYFFLGWLIIILGFWGMTKFEGTRTILYYMLILLIVLDLVTHSTEIANILAAAGFTTQLPPNQAELQNIGGPAVHAT